MNPLSTRLGARTTAAAVGALVVLAASAVPASAHVRVEPDSTVAGSYAALTFRVPNESDTASTTEVVVTLPQDQPLRHVSVRPVPGWRATVAEADLPEPITLDGSTLTKAARTVTWTATGDQAIAPGQYQEFAVSAGPLPSPGTVVLPVAQTYSDGEVVEWNEPTPASGEEPEHPAPTLTVGAAAAGAAGHGHSDADADGSMTTAAAAAETTASVAAAASTSADHESSSAPTIIAVVSLVVAAAALLVAAVALRRRPAGTREG